MTNHTEDALHSQTPKGREALPTTPGAQTRPQQDDWRLSRSDRSLRSWRLSK